MSDTIGLIIKGELHKKNKHLCPSPKCKGNGTTDKKHHHCKNCQEWYDGFTGIDFYKAMKKEVTNKKKQQNHGGVEFG